MQTVLKQLKEVEQSWLDRESQLRYLSSERDKYGSKNVWKNWLWTLGYIRVRFGLALSTSRKRNAYPHQNFDGIFSLRMLSNL